MKLTPSTTISIEIEADREKVFTITVPIDLPSIFKASGLIPAVIATNPPTGSPWNVPGLERQVLLADGNRVREKLLQVEFPSYFCYKVFDFTNFIGWFALSAIGEWQFKPNEKGTQVTWTYTFCSKNPLFKPLLVAIVEVPFHNYMKQALLTLKARIESDKSNE